MIRKASLDDLKRIIEITQACANLMISKNIFQWNEFYPRIQTFEEDVNNQTLYVIENNSKVIGCLVISDYMDEFYKKAKWLTVSDKNIYLHRLAVHPDYQGKGFAKKLMNYAFDFALENEFKSIRLDTFSGNPQNNVFYQKLDFKKLEKIYFRDQSDKPFYCYEKVL
jgi:ribosomal protein S18 acetylase RimI-like enzyme